MPRPKAEPKWVVTSYPDETIFTKTYRASSMEVAAKKALRDKKSLTRLMVQSIEDSDLFEIIDVSHVDLNDKKSRRRGREADRDYKSEQVWGY